MVFITIHTENHGKSKRLSIKNQCKGTVEPSFLHAEEPLHKIQGTIKAQKPMVTIFHDLSEDQMKNLIPQIEARHKGKFSFRILTSKPISSPLFKEQVIKDISEVFPLYQ